LTRAIIRERVRAGIERAKASGTKSGRRFGRPGSKGLAKIAAIKAELAADKGIRRVARDLGAGVGTVLRVKAEIAA
jgi:DNA invertase Pin-like site-specific DNA recombinase